MAEFAVGAELDAEVARRVFGNDVLGLAPCTPDPECGELQVGEHGWGEPRVRPLVHIGGCDCASLSEPGDSILLQHTALRLEPVPEYSTDIAAAWLVVERLRDTAESEQWMDFVDDISRRGGLLFAEAIAAERVCRAALVAAERAAEED